MSTDCANEARKAVCNFFGANAEEYCVIFTSNASGALKLVGESYPFAEGDSFVLGTDSHNSVNGIRQFAAAAGSNVVYMPSTPNGGIEIDGAKVRSS
jgi:selenocysteine lyase/cysteine desulfurase